MTAIPTLTTWASASGRVLALQALFCVLEVAQAPTAPFSATLPSHSTAHSTTHSTVESTRRTRWGQSGATTVELCGHDLPVTGVEAVLGTNTRLPQSLGREGRRESAGSLPTWVQPFRAGDIVF